MAKETTRKLQLTDRSIRALKPARDGKPYDVRDDAVSGLRVRVMGSGYLSFVLLARFPRNKQAARRALGVYAPLSPAEESNAKSAYEKLAKEERRHLSLDAYMLRTYGAVTLAGARERARQWKQMIQAGIDPAVEEERQRQAKIRAQRTTFAAVAEEYIAKKVAKTAKAVETEQDIRRELMARWGAKPISDVSRLDVIMMTEEIAERAPYQAHNVFGHARGLFNWAIERDIYGLEASPCDRLKPRNLIGKREPRSRVLTDAEIAALWQVTAALDYPCGPMVRMLAITGQRLKEVAWASWREFDLDAKLWSIPAARMKMDAPHLVPLSPLALETLATLPHFRGGEFIFSARFGKSPFNGFARMKARIDELMAKYLREAPPPPWVLHDIRRSVRTRLSALRVPHEVRELVIAHTKKGLDKVYDQHAFLDEKRDALERWSARLRGIVEPPPPNIVHLDAARA
jgi:integrase